MQGEGQPVAHRVEVYLRSLLPEGYSDHPATTLDRLAALVDRGVVGERHVQLCGCQVPATPESTRTAVGARIAARLSMFREWARRNDRSLTPALALREVDNSLTGCSYRAVRLPVILLAEFRGGELRCVTPHRDGDTVQTVPDRIAELEAGDPTVYEPVPARRLAVAPTETNADDRDAEERTPLAGR